MTRIIQFADSFTSASAPVVSGGSQEDYIIVNNQASPLEIFTIDSLKFKSAFIYFELEREDVSNEYRQSGNALIHFDGINWVYNLANYQGDDLINDSITNPEQVLFQIDTTAGVGSFKYSSGNMGASYSGNFRAFITRIITT